MKTTTITSEWAKGLQVKPGPDGGLLIVCDTGKRLLGAVLDRKAAMLVIMKAIVVLDEGTKPDVQSN